MLAARAGGHGFPGRVARQLLGVDARLQRRRDLLARQRAAHDVGVVERVEGEEHDVGARGLADRLGQAVAHLVGRDERSLRRGVGRRPQRRTDRDEQLVAHVIEPGAARCLPGERVRHERRPREVDVVLFGIVGAGDQDAPIVGHQHPAGPDQIADVVRLIERVGPATTPFEQPLAVLGHVGGHGAGAAERARARREEIRHRRAGGGERALNRRVRGAIGLERRDAEGDAEHHHDEQRRRDEDLPGEPEADALSSARVRHSWDSPCRTCSCAPARGSRAR